MKKKKAVGKKMQEKRAERTAADLIKNAFSFNLSGTTAIILILAVVFIFFIIYAITRPVPPAVSTSYSDPLNPVTGLKIAPGEKYVYEWIDPQLGIVKISNTVGERTGGCILVATASVNMSLPFCLDTATGEPKAIQQSEKSFNMSPQFAQPWMLSLKENWVWRTDINTTVEWMGTAEKIESSSTYRVVELGSIKGRPAYKVLIEATVKRINGEREYKSDSSAQIVWIDSEKRILLYAGEKDSHIELIEAPFKIEPYSEAK